MLSKVHFEVVECTSSAEGYDFRELEGGSQNPQTKGWQSAKFCEFPQTIVLRLERECNIRKIQILSHQSKIANCIEVYIGSSVNGNPDHTKAVFTRLGYLSLDSNERSQFKARELKSVYVNCRGAFLKLIVVKCHVNSLNLFNQVGIVAVNIMGLSGKAEQGPEDELATKYGVDDKTARQIRELMRRKERSIIAEDYDECKRIKHAIDNLLAVGKQLAELERRKRDAVSREDFDQAKEIKRQMEDLRVGALKKQRSPEHPPKQLAYQGSVGSLQSRFDEEEQQQQQQAGLRMGGYEDHAAAAPQAKGQKKRARTKQVFPDEADEAEARASAAAALLNPDDRPIHGVGSRPAQPEEYPPETVPVPPAIAEDDRPLPTTAGKQTSGGLEADPDEKDDGGGAGADEDQDMPDDPNGENPLPGLPPPEPLNAAQKKEAEPLIEALGQHTVQCLYSKQWSLRQHAVKQTQMDLEQGKVAAEPRQVLNTSAKVLRMVLNDKVPQVFLSGTNLLNKVVDMYGNQVKPDELRTALEPLMQAITDKLGNVNERSRKGATQAVLFMASHPNVDKNMVFAAILKPLKKKEQNNPWPVKGRALLLCELIPKHGLSDQSTLSLPNVMKQLVPYLPHRDASVRDMMVKLATVAYASAGSKRVNPYLKDVRPVIMDSLNASFAEADAGRFRIETANGDMMTITSQPGEGGDVGAKPAADSKVPGDSKSESKACQFCGLEDPAFTDEQLDLHYWQDCPMLTTCSLCDQVVEISSLNEHLLTDCEAQAPFDECPRCRELVPADRFQEHVQQQACRKALPVEQANRCPLCKKDTPPGEQGWKVHLLKQGCLSNPRSKVKPPAR